MFNDYVAKVGNRQEADYIVCTYYLKIFLIFLLGTAGKGTKKGSARHFCTDKALLIKFIQNNK